MSDRVNSSELSETAEFRSPAKATTTTTQKLFVKNKRHDKYCKSIHFPKIVSFHIVLPIHPPITERGGRESEFDSRHTDTFL